MRKKRIDRQTARHLTPRRPAHPIANEVRAQTRRCCRCILVPAANAPGVGNNSVNESSGWHRESEDDSNKTLYAQMRQTKNTNVVPHPIG